MKFICAMLLLFSIKASAQYPFEKYPAIKYRKAIFKPTTQENALSIVKVAKYNDYSIEIREVHAANNLDDYCKLTIYKKTKIILQQNVDHDLVYADQDFPVCFDDINGDGFLDIKFTYPNSGASGLASSIVFKLYYFGQRNNKFKKISFRDFYWKANEEFDLDNDGNYEIMGQSHVSYRNHSYWVFNIYNYRDGKLVNVSKKYNYPILIQMLFKDNYTVTNNVSRSKIKDFLLDFPDDIWHY